MAISFLFKNKSIFIYFIGWSNLKFFKSIGIITIVIFSFFYTEKLANFMLENNELYQTIENEKDSYEVVSVNAVIDGDYIIPGLNGQVVNVKDSYYNMKDMQVFNSYYLLYDVTYPEISLSNNIDKIITKGNSLKRSVSFILEYDQDIINFFVNNNYDASVIVTSDTYDSNLTLEQINGDVSNFSQTEALLNKYNDNISICYVSNVNLELCKDNNKYLVNTEKIINNSTIIDIKNNISSGDIYYVSKNVDLKNIQLIINSILYRDLEIVNISELISEERSWIIKLFLV